MTDTDKYAGLREALDNGLGAINAAEARLLLADLATANARVGELEAERDEYKSMCAILLHEHDVRVLAHREQTPTNRMRSLRAHEEVDAVVREWRGKKDAAAREAVDHG